MNDKEYSTEFKVGFLTGIQFFMLMYVVLSAIMDIAISMGMNKILTVLMAISVGLVFAYNSNKIVRALSHVSRSIEGV